MSTAVRFTAEQFDRVMDGAVFRDDPERRFELILGEIREMVQPGPLHENIIDLLAEWSFANVNTRHVRVRIEKTLGIPELDSVPRPDVAWVKQQDYSGARPRVKDVLLIIEVSDTTLAFDTRDKLLLYAQAGIKDYWVVDVKSKAVRVFRGPTKKGYRSAQAFSLDDEVAPLAVPDAKLAVKSLFP
jgi:Uma2 family endonuclease